MTQFGTASQANAPASNLQVVPSGNAQQDKSRDPSTSLAQVPKNELNTQDRVAQANGELVHQTKTMGDLAVDARLENINSYIAPGDVVQGSLMLRGGARVAGTITGSLFCESGSAIIEETGAVHGSVSATMRVIVAGRIGLEESQGEGNTVECPNELVVLGTGDVRATVSYGSLSTYDGGKVTGMVRPFEKR